MFVFLLMVGNVVQFYFLLCMAVYLSLSVYGIVLYFIKNEKKFLFDHRFVILVPAHNEEKVIGNLIDSLKKLDYPTDKYDVYIICDNCSDETEKIVIENGVKCLVHREKFSNKAKALNYGISEILKQNSGFDAFCFFDADSLAHPDFLKAMSYMLGRGYKVIQGHQIPKNPYESIISMIVSAGQYVTNRFFQKPKMHLNISATLHGKGMCFSKDIIEKYQWDENCLTEDLEMQMNLVKNDVFIAWSEYAVVYDEQPITVKQYIKRSVRWTKGSIVVAKKHAVGLFINFIKKFKLSSLEAFLYTVGVYRVFMIFFTGFAMYYTKNRFNLLVYLFNLIPYERILIKFIVLVIPLIILPVIIWFEKGIKFKMIFAYYMQPLLGFFRLPIFIMGILKPAYVWDVVEHTSSVRISDILKKED